MKIIIKKLFNFFGYNLNKKKKNFFLQNKIDLIIDVGAHKGEFALSVLKENFKGKIISFEPQNKIYNIIKNKSKKYKSWIVHYKCGIGKKNENLFMNIMKETTCSSFLKPTKNLFNIDPTTKILKKEKSKIFSLNFLFTNTYKLKKKTFLKIDTQGFDKFVLDGASRILNKILFVQLELSIDPLYKNEKNYMKMIHYMKKRGFIIWKFGDNIENSIGKTMSFDIIFKNKRF